MKALLKRDGWPVAGIASLTICGQLAVLLGSQACGVSPRAAMLASLMLAGLWIALASPVFAAGPQSAFSGLLRGGIVADATAVLLVVLWLTRPEVSFISAVKLYCIYASVALCGVAGARLASSERFRYLTAVATAGFLAAMQSSLFWLPGLLQLVPSADKSAVAGAVLRGNPLYGVFSAIADQTHFVWHYASIMYRITPLGEDIAVGPIYWYEPMAICLTIACLLASTWLLRPRRR